MRYSTKRLQNGNRALRIEKFGSSLPSCIHFVVQKDGLPGVQYLFITCHMIQVRPKATRPMPATEHAKKSGFQAFDKLRFKHFVDQMALLNEDGLNGPIGGVIENDAMTANPEPVVAREVRFEGAEISTFVAKFDQCLFDGPTGPGGEPARIRDDLN